MPSINSPVPPTATPTAPAATLGPAAWERTEYQFGAPTEVWNVWAVGDRFVVYAEREGPDGPVVVFLSATTGRDWHAVTAPDDLEEIYFRTGTVVDGRLWFVARVRGSGSDTRRLVSTTTGDDWEMLEPARGLGASDGASFLTRVGNRWFAGPRRETPSEPFPVIDQDIRVSDDGVHWSEVDAPRFGSFTLYHDVEVVGAQVLVSATWYEDEEQQSFFMTSHSGAAWQSADFPPRTNASSGGFACSPMTCVMVGSISAGDGELELPFAWASKDGLRWTEVDPTPEFPAGRTNVPMGDVVWTGSAFLATGGNQGGDAWLSDDGAAWRFVQVMPMDTDEPIQSVAVVGDRIIGLYGDGAASGRLAIWIGSLAAMFE